MGVEGGFENHYSLGHSQDRAHPLLPDTWHIISSPPRSQRTTSLLPSIYPKVTNPPSYFLSARVTSQLPATRDVTICSERYRWQIKYRGHEEKQNWNIILTTFKHSDTASLHVLYIFHAIYTSHIVTVDDNNNRRNNW